VKYLILVRAASIGQGYNLLKEIVSLYIKVIKADYKSEHLVESIKSFTQEFSERVAYGR
jgi:hypothetical protein